MNNMVVEAADPVPVMSERDREIADLYLGGYSAAVIARQLGISAPLVYKVLAKHGIKRPEGTARRKAEKSSISPTHFKVGLRLYDHRVGTRAQDRVQASETIGWTSKKLALVEQGEYSLTLEDLQDISGYMKISLSELLNGL